MKIVQLQSEEYAPYYLPYIQQVREEELIEGLHNSLVIFIQFINSVPAEKLDYRYAIGKWTLKDIIQHLIDSERIFSYRALRFSRKDTVKLSSFEEDLYAEAALANNRTLKELLEEFKLVRQSTIALFKSFSDETLLRIGIAADYPISVRALGYIIIGHQKHHINVYKHQYLIDCSRKRKIKNHFQPIIFMKLLKYILMIIGFFMGFMFSLIEWDLSNIYPLDENFEPIINISYQQMIKLIKSIIVYSTVGVISGFVVWLIIFYFFQFIKKYRSTGL